MTISSGNAKPQVSIIIPVFNGADTITEAIQSLQKQTIANYEAIVIDDASTDFSVELIAKMAAEDPRIRLIRQPVNCGVSAARNVGLENALGEWVAVLDADDWYEAERLERFLSFANTEHSDVIIDNLKIYDHATHSIHNTTNFMRSDNVLTVTASQLFAADNPLRDYAIGYAKPFIRRRYLQQTGLNYNHNFSLGEDFLLLAELSLTGAVINALPASYYVYRHRISPSTGAISPFSRSPHKADQIIEISRYLREKYADQINQNLMKLILLREKHFKHLKLAATLKRLLKERNYANFYQHLSTDFTVIGFILQMTFKSYVRQRNTIIMPSENNLMALLRADMSVLNAHGKNGSIKFLRLLGRPGFLAVVLHRLAAASFRKGKIGRIFATLLSRFNQTLTGCDINNQAAIGPGFKLPHPTGVVIGIAKVGRNVMMLQNTTLGMQRFTDDETDAASYPVIGDNVTLCCGAVVAGHVRVGNGAIVGANAVVLQDVPDNHTAVGSPARIFLSTKS